MRTVSRKLIKRLFNLVGLDIVKAHEKNPSTLLGLRALPIRSIIDVGANEGKFAKDISAVFPQAAIYCFEPLAEPRGVLEHWAASQNGRVRVYNVALGDRDGTVEMHRHVEHSDSSSLLKTTEACESLYPLTKKQDSIKVELKQLDTMVQSLSKPLDADLLIKLDVQGYEDRVIRGAGDTMARAQACILEVCLVGLYQEQATFEDIVLMLHERGFRYAGNLEQTYARDGSVVFLDALFLK